MSSSWLSQFIRGLKSCERCTCRHVFGEVLVFWQLLQDASTPLEIVGNDFVCLPSPPFPRFLREIWNWNVETSPRPCISKAPGKESRNGSFQAPAGPDSRGGIPGSRIRIPAHPGQEVKPWGIGKFNKNKELLTDQIRFGMVTKLQSKGSGRTPNDDLHGSPSEGEGACSGICDGRSHLPLRGKLGWMTPRPGQKKAGKRNASLGLSFPSEGPFLFCH